MKNVKLVATDLDGTFLLNDRTISSENLQALKQLGDAGIIRVAATGRNLRKVEEVVSDNVPFDYIVFSSGAGIYNWKSKKHISGINIESKPALAVTNFLKGKQLNFHAFFPVPENHHLYYYRGIDQCDEFERYFTFHNSWSLPLPEPPDFPGGLCQFLIIIREDPETFEKLKTRIEAVTPEVRVIRSSSPITRGFIWIEVFNRRVSKGNGILQVCRLESIDPEDTLSVGNDYNDIDMLETTAHSFLTDNAPEEIKRHYVTISSNEEHGFSHLVNRLIH